jgi:signal transduction histidine kinase
MFAQIRRRLQVITAVLMVVFAGLALVAFRAYSDMKADRDRLKENQSFLLHNGEVEIKQTNTGCSQASVPALTLRPSEFRRSGDTLLRTAKAAGIKVSRISEAATAATTTHVDFDARVFRTVVHDTLRDTVLCSASPLPALSWNDPWVSLSGTIADSIFHGSLTSNDTLDIIVHRIPKRFLFFRFGCKQVRMDIISRNPHTRLTYARYYQLVK